MSEGGIGREECQHAPMTPGAVYGGICRPEGALDPEIFYGQAGEERVGRRGGAGNWVGGRGYTTSPTSYHLHPARSMVGRYVCW